jgi:hypothetical protein
MFLFLCECFIRFHSCRPTLEIYNFNGIRNPTSQSVSSWPRISLAGPQKFAYWPYSYITDEYDDDDDDDDDAHTQNVFSHCGAVALLSVVQAMYSFQWGRPIFWSLPASKSFDQSKLNVRTTQIRISISLSVHLIHRTFPETTRVRTFAILQKPCWLTRQRTQVRPW